MHKRLVAVLAVLLVVGTGDVQAQEETVGTLGIAGNCMPFGCFPLTRYQQVYSATLFDAMRIEQIDFFYTNPMAVLAAPPLEFQQANFSFYLSTTSLPLGGLTSDLGANFEPLSRQHFFSGDLTETTISNPGTLSFHGTPFDYDPGENDEYNLLLDIVLAWDGGLSGEELYESGQTHVWGTSDDTVFLDANESSVEFSRAYDYPIFGAYTDNHGLVTRFSSAQTVVPEPATIGLLATGLICIAGVARRRRQRGLSEDV